MRCGARVQLALWFTALAGFTCAAAGGDPGVPAVGAAGPVGKAAVSGSNQRQTSEDAVTPAPYTYTLGGTWEQEWAVADRGGNQKFEALLEPRLDVRFRSGASLTAIARLRLDALDELGPSAQRPFNYSAVNGPWYNDGNAAIDLREFYLDMQLGGAYLRLGKQQVVWGESDGVKVLDVVNPQSFREFILKDPAASRIPLWTVNVELPAGPGGVLQLLWIPDTTYDELAESGTPYALTSPLVVPRRPPGMEVTLLEPDRPDRLIADSDAGARYRVTAGGWDVSLNYLYSYADFPVPFQRLQWRAGKPVGVMQPAYRRNHLLGATASSVFGDVTLRTEVAWNSDRWFTSSDRSAQGVEKSADIASVLGLDWQASASSVVSGQWFYNRALDHESTMERGQNEQIVSLLLQHSWANDAWEFRTLALHSLDYSDSLYQVKLKYWFSSAVELWVGADIFDGTGFGLFGQYDDHDRLLVGLQYGF